MLTQEKEEALSDAPATARRRPPGHGADWSRNWLDTRISTTQRYMHLSPAALEGAIKLLDHQGPLKLDTTYERKLAEEILETYWRRRIVDPLSPIVSVL